MLRINVSIGKSVHGEVSADIWRQKVNRGFKNESKRVRDAAERGVRKAIKLLFKASQNIVPVDTGRLKGSGKIVESGRGTSRFNAKIVYRAPYAIYVHEDLTARHKPGQFAKFIEAPARILRPAMLAIIRAEIEAARATERRQRGRARRR